MTKTELLAEILGEAREYEHEDGASLATSKGAIQEGLAADMKELARILNRKPKGITEPDITPVTRRSLVQAAGAIVALLTDDLTADKPEAEVEFP